jgi:hypothetical protein
VTRRNGTASAVGRAVLVAGLSVLFGTVGIASSSADGKSYLQKLKDAGISTPRGDYEVQEWGYEVCALRALGRPPRQWVEQAVYQSQLHPPYGLTKDQANTIVNLAVSELCDDRDGPPPYLPAP